MELQQLVTFHRIVQVGTFSAAAEKLGYSQAAVTIQIRKLEEELGTRLFDRIGRTVSLTNDGKIFHSHVVKILNEVSDAQECIAKKDVLSGSLRIGTIDSLCTSLLIEPIEKFHQAHPSVAINITTDSIDGLLNMLQKNDIDLAYLADRSIADADFIKVQEELVHAVFVSAPDHPLAEKPHISMDTLLQYPMLLTERDASYRTILEDDLARNHLELHPFLESKNTDMIVYMVRHRLGISFLPDYFIRDQLQTGALALLDTDYQAEIYIQLLYHRNKWVTPEMKAFFAIFNEELREKQSGVT